VGNCECKLAAPRTLQVYFEEVVMDVQGRISLAYFAPLRPIPFKSTFVEGMQNKCRVGFVHDTVLHLDDGVRVAGGEVGGESSPLSYLCLGVDLYEVLLRERAGVVESIGEGFLW
jgi:hypothetical protein